MTLNCNGKILDLHTKKIMGIINLSQDSFYDGGKYDSIDKVNAQISSLVSNGAEIIDIGAVSSKPGSKLIDPKKELDIVSDYIIELSNNFKLPEAKFLGLEYSSSFLLSAKNCFFNLSTSIFNESLNFILLL